MYWRNDLKDFNIPTVLPSSVMGLCETISRITAPMEPLIKSTVMLNGSFQPVMESVAMMNRSLSPLGQAVTEMNRSLAPFGKAAAVMNSSLYPLGHAVGAIVRSGGGAGVGAAMSSPGLLQVGEVVREMTTVGAALNKAVGDSVGNDFFVVAEALRNVDWRAAIEQSLEDAEEDQGDELKSEAEAAGSFLNAEFQSILDEVEQTPQGMIAALTVLRERVVESPLGKATKTVVLWMLSVILGNLFWAYVCVPVGKGINQPFTHREALKATKQHVLKEVGYHPQLRIVSVESRLNIRMKPNRKSHVVGKLYPHTVVTVTGHAGKWARVYFANGHDEEVEGWVFNKYLSKLKN